MGKIMGRKVFVSYKYSDSQVQDLNIYEDSFFGRIKVQTTARHYVDKLTDILEGDDHIYKGEDDDESMESLADSTIGSKLGDKIFNSSVTIVLISKGMKNPFLPESEQWIPWEISYSLKQQDRQGQKSKTNGVMALVLPDEIGSYSYYITSDPECDCRMLNTGILFTILSANMFNVKSPNRTVCNGKWIYHGDYSYIDSVKWSDFVVKPSKYIDKAIELRDRKDEFELRKNIR
jgi:hypothetical protein